MSSVEVASFTTLGRTYRVYPDHGYCTCPHHVNTGAHCKHLKSLTAQVYTITRVEAHDGYRRTSRFDIHDSEGNYEGRLPSFADAYETIVEDLGGVLGKPEVRGYYGGEVA